MTRPTIMIVFGTRPEAIKMAPVIKALQALPQFEIKICVTGQHRELLDQVLDVFDIHADDDLRIMESEQTLVSLTARLLFKMEVAIQKSKPSMLLVHGDTTTSMVASLAGFYAGIPIGHVEAGLRTGNKQQPYPEEVNRRLTAVLADVHFAPTEQAKNNLLREGILEQSIKVTGNTVIDALYSMTQRLDGDAGFRASTHAKLPKLDLFEKVVLITGHRRENFGAGFDEICRAIVQLAQEHSEVGFVYPVHLNPQVRRPVESIVGTVAQNNIFLIEPVDYPSFVELLRRCYLVLTDSGGIQEEATSLGKPVVVMRAITERPEALHSGNIELVGCEKESIVTAVSRLLKDKIRYRYMSRTSDAYGDGYAAGRIATHISQFLKNRTELRLS